ncbi:MAG TPA: decarboxylating 6-phosphogluconate dehydrogenase, partial [Tepidisphaeraceae bacterium]|nr:decarboxylating 6-phosphogluconate dehydrogenase [Tepidisphaeraceae bacterium]
IGFVGLGKMGGNMALRLVQGSPDGKIKGGHRVVGFAKDPNPDLVGVPGIWVVDSLEAMVSKLQTPRVVWVMVPAGASTEGVIGALAKLMHEDDIIIDGGNSHYKDSVRRSEGLGNRLLGFLDVGTSGGVWGRQEGYCMMVGGQPAPVEHCRPIFDTLAPPDGWIHTGPAGSGHFVKMVHNGIEYGLMEAYAEGFDVLHKSPFRLNLNDIANVWNHGSVIRSWLLELSQNIFKEEADLHSIAPYVVDSGEGQWTIQAAMEEAVPVPVMAAALFSRYASRDPENFAARYTAALRNQFGGHAIKKAEENKIEATGELKK